MAAQQIPLVHPKDRVSQPSPLIPARSINLNVRVINPDKKKEYEIYILRNVTKDKVTSPQLLRKELLHQFSDKIVSPKLNFSVGFIKSGAKVTIQSSTDINDVWQCALRGENITLWCVGIRSGTHDESSDSVESDSENVEPTSKRKKLSYIDEKTKHIGNLVTTLKTKHGNQFTTIQYRLWAEMLDVGTYRFVGNYIKHIMIPFYVK